MQLTAAMVGMLGGPALQVLVVLSIEREPRALSFLCDMTNLSDKTCSQAVRKLKTLGMIVETGRYLYQVAGEIKQLPLMAPELPAESESAQDPIALDDDEQDLGRKFSDLALNESINESMTLPDEDDSLIDGDASSEIPEKPTTALLQGLGFYGRGIADLLHIPGLEMAEVRWQVEHAPNLGCALARIKKRQAWGDGRRERDGPGEGKQYVGGKFAAFIQH